MTAAHCVQTTTKNGAIYYGYVTYADHKLGTTDTNEQVVEIANVISHPSYTESTFDYDYALVQVKTAVSFNTWQIQPVCLPESCASACQGGEVGYVTGWGLTDYSNSSSFANSLQKIIVQVYSSFDCAVHAIGFEPKTDRMVCAGYLTANYASCNVSTIVIWFHFQKTTQFLFDNLKGDSGGPLTVVSDGFFELCGLVSHGVKCGTEENYLDFYSRVCTVRSWIKTNSGT